MSRRRLLMIGAVVVFMLGVASPAAADGAEVTAFAGTGEAGFSGDGGAAAEALLDHPAGVAAAPDGTVYISDTANHVVRKVAPDGTVGTIAGDGEQGAPGAEFADGTPATGVSLGAPGNLAVGADGSLYITDAALFRVFKVDTDGRLTVTAGNGLPQHAGDGGPAPQASIGTPGGLAIAPDGRLYVADVAHHRIRAIGTDGVISTIAGDGGTAITAAGGVAAALPVPFATSLAVGSDGALWIADAGGLVQKLDDGRISTVTVPSAGRWDLDTGETWPTADPALNNITAVVTAGDGVYTLDGQSGTVLLLDADKSTPSAITLPDPLSGPFTMAGDRAYLVDTDGNRVWTALATVAPPSGDADSGNWWLYAAGGAAVVVAAVVLLLAVRRRPQR